MNLPLNNFQDPLVESWASRRPSRRDAGMNMD